MEDKDKPDDGLQFTESNCEATPECSFAACIERSLGYCRKCAQPFCLSHSSDIDPHFCEVCVTQSEIESHSEPLVDVDGVTHSGRRILATGDAFHFASKMIFDMDKLELLQHIDHCRTAIELLGKQLDYWKIQLTTAEFEAYERELGSLKRVGGEIRFAVNNTTRERLASGMSKDEVKRRLRKKTSAKRSSETLFETLKGMNLSEDQLRGLLGLKKQ